MDTKTETFENSPIQLSTDRLYLRNCIVEDVHALKEAINDYLIADMMNDSIPFPYNLNHAQQWIKRHKNDSLESSSISLIVFKKNHQLIGSASIHILEPGKGRLSYWIKRSQWGKGYATEAGRCFLNFAFKSMKLHKVEAEHYERNPASGRVLNKLGFTYSHTTSKKVHEKIENFCNYYIIQR